MTPIVLALALVLTAGPGHGRDARAERCQALLPAIETAAREAGVDMALVVAIVAHESGFRSQTNKRSGARGLMQVMPEVGRRLGCGDLDDEVENLRCGTRLLARFLSRYEGRIVFGLAGYGGGNVIAGKASDDRVVPSNFGFVEQILGMRTRFLREGCVL